MKRPSFLISVVLYKQNIIESSTILSLIKIVDFLNNTYDYKIFVWDNSPQSLSEDDLKPLNQFYDFEYLSTPENISLSKIYNTTYSKYNKYDLLVLLDQDSCLDKDYFIKLQMAYNCYDRIDLFLPIVMFNDIICSPADQSFIMGRYWKQKELGLVCSKKKLAITSGMAIKIKYLLTNHPSFNEELSLYGIDTDFMMTYSEKNKKFYVMDYELIHDLSIFNEKESIEQKKFRFINHRKSLKIIFKKRSYFLYIIIRVKFFIKTIFYSVKFKHNFFND